MNKLTVVALAAFVALLSGAALVHYVAGAQDRAADAVGTVPVLIATADIPDGTAFDDAWAAGSIVESETVRRMRPPTAVTDPTELQGTLTNGVLLDGQLVVQGTFVDPEDAEDAGLPRTFADSLPEGTVAVSFEAAGAQAVSDLISPGDRVDMFVRVPNANELGLPDSGGPAVVQAFHDLRVIAIGAALAPVAGAEAAVPNPGAGSYTVAVSSRDAARLLLLTRQYDTYLTLVGPGASGGAEAPVTKIDALPDATSAEGSGS